jgi:hypothetical protein
MLFHQFSLELRSDRSLTVAAPIRAATVRERFHNATVNFLDGVKDGWE